MLFLISGLSSHVFDDFSEWLLGNIFEQTLKPFLQEKFGEFGFSEVIVAALVGACIYLATKAVMQLDKHAAEIDWYSLDPSDEQQMMSAYQDLNIVLTAARKLGEDPADTLEKFRDQVSRLGLFQTTLWDRADQDNSDTMKKLFQNSKIVSSLASILDKPEPKNFDQFVELIREYRAKKLA